MDVTPQLLTEVEFRQSLRGYDVDEVDGFLEEVATSVATLRGRLQAALERADAVDQGYVAASAAPGETVEAGVTTETITRTLLLAQQTADETVSAARDEVSTLLSEARSEADRVRAEASAEAERLVAEAQDERERVLASVTADAETAGQHAKFRIDGEISELEVRRDSLRQRVEAAAPELERQRNRLMATMAALQELVEDDAAFVVDLDVDLGADLGADSAAEVDLRADVGADAEPVATDVASDVASDADEIWISEPDDAPAVTAPDSEVAGWNNLSGDGDEGEEDEGEETVVFDIAELDAELAAVPTPSENDDVEHIDHVNGEGGDEAEVDMTSASVFGASTWADSGPPTEQVAVVDLTDETLENQRSSPSDDDAGAVDDGADAARALDDFFDAGPNEPVRRFGRTRS